MGFVEGADGKIRYFATNIAAEEPSRDFSKARFALSKACLRKLGYLPE